MSSKLVGRNIVRAVMVMMLFTPPAHAEEPPLPESTAVQEPPDRPPVYIGPAGSSPGDIVPMGEKIQIATTSAWETNPAVAMCPTFDQYLVVYEREGDIYGQRLNSSGGLLGAAFVIYNGSNSAHDPDVSCEAAHNQYVVTWTYDYGTSDSDIKAQAVYGSHQSTGSQLVGSVINVASATLNEKNSAIACNGTDHNCLVVYENDAGADKSVYAQRLSVGVSGISKLGTSFDFASPMPQYQPDVAWNGVSNNFLVVWQETYVTPSNHYRIFFAHVHSVDQGAGEERQHGNTFLVNPGKWDCNQVAPAVAHNRATGWFLVTFQFDYYCDGGSHYDILAQRVSATGQGVAQLDPFWAAWGNASSADPAVAYRGGAEPYGVDANQFLVTYLSYTDNVYAIHGQVLKGTHDPSVSDEQNDGGSIQQIDRISLPGWYLARSNVTGSVNNGRYLTVWEYGSGGIAPDKDVLGRIFMVPFYLFLPSIVR